MNGWDILAFLLWGLLGMGLLFTALVIVFAHLASEAIMEEEYWADMEAEAGMGVDS